MVTADTSARRHSLEGTYAPMATSMHVLYTKLAKSLCVCVYTVYLYQLLVITSHVYSIILVHQGR